MENNCAENLISANHFLRDREPWPPMQAYDNGRDDTYGLLYIEGSNNSIIANHISETLDVQYLKPRLKALDAVAVLVEKSSAQNTILDSGSDSQVLMDRAVNAFRATPVPGTI